MALVNQPWNATPGMGIPNVGLFNYGIALSGTTQATKSLTLGTSSNIAGYSQAGSSFLQCGWLYLRIYNPGGTSPTVIVAATITDGTTTETILLPMSAVFALSATSVLRLAVPFATDLLATSISVLTTLGGTSPTASLDLAVACASGVTAS